MIGYQNFILENFLNVIKDQSTRDKIKELMKSGKTKEAYDLMRKTPHERKPLTWSTKNPKLHTGKWKEDNK